MSSFKNLKKNKTDRIKKLQEKLKNDSGYADDREWKLTRDSKTDVGQAIIRFLPSKNPDDDEFYTTYYEHNFKKNKNDKRFYNEKCRTTLNGENDPVQDKSNHYWELYNQQDQTNDSHKQNAIKFSRKQKYATNIFVIKDRENPENDGKVFIYKFGPAIMKMVEKCLEEQEANALEEKKVFDPSCPWDGANLLITIKKDEAKGFYVYDDSKFQDNSPLAKTDKEMEDIWNKGYDLSEFTDPDTFKSYEELGTKMNQVLGISTSKNLSDEVISSIPSSNDDDDDDDDDPFNIPDEVGSEDEFDFDLNEVMKQVE